LQTQASYGAVLDTDLLTADRDFSFPDESGTLATQEYVATLSINDLSVPAADINFNEVLLNNIGDPIDPQDAATKAYVDAVAAALAAGSTATGFTVTQTAHGFAAGDVLRNAGSANTYAKAKAATAAHAEVVGIVTGVPDANHFTLTTQGVAMAGVPAVAAGTVLFLSAASAGALTATEPSADGEVSKPLAVVLENATRMAFFNYRGEVINTASGGGGGGGSIAVSEIDGGPSVSPVTEIIVTNGILTDNADGTVTLSAGDVAGPASATDNALARYDSTSGKVLQNSVVTLSDSGLLSGLAAPGGSVRCGEQGIRRYGRGRHHHHQDRRRLRYRLPGGQLCQCRCRPQCGRQ
jgi:hypothetical protein